MFGEVMSELISQLELAVGIDFVKGFPSWGRGTLTPPVGSVRLMETLVTGPPRIGGRPQRQSATWSVSIFGKNEPGMLEMLESLMSWVRGTVQMVVEGVGVEVSAQVGLRHDNVSGSQQEDYGFYVLIVTIW